jgi:hypothetical protein
LPGSAPAAVAVPAPGPGRLQWAGSPGAALDSDGSVLLAYRLRYSEGASTVVARSEDGERFETLATLTNEQFGAFSMERPALVRTETGWRLYVCCATPNSKHWWIDALDAEEPSDFDPAERRTPFPGDEHTAVKDPIVRRTNGGWEAWICCHPLDESDEEDRMSSAYATSDDGLDWTWHGTVLTGRPGKWDGRGARLTAVLHDGRAAYDGRATKEENWFERTGLAQRTSDGRYEPIGDDPVVDARYLEVLSLPDGGYRIYYEARLPDESHELRTELIRP